MHLYFKILEIFFVKFARLVLILCNFLPETICWKIGDILGIISWYFTSESKDISIKNLKIIMPELNDDEIREKIIIQFQNQYKNMFELLRYSKLSKERLNEKIKFEGRKNLEIALREKKGVILLVPHMGNWELLGATWSFLGLDLNSFFLDLRFRKLGKMLNYQRRLSGINLISRNEIKKSIKVLKRNGILGILADQDGGEGGFITEFFGRRVSFPSGPIRIQRLTGSAVIPNVLIRNRDNTYTMKVFPPLPMVRTNNRRSDDIINLATMKKFYEDIIKEYPEQWLLMYDRFKKRRHINPN